MNAIQMLTVAFFLIAGGGLYYFLRVRFNWPPKNNPLFFFLIFSPSLGLALSPFSNHIFSHVVFAFNAGLFFADSLYQWRQDKKLIKRENIQRKSQLMKQKNKNKPPNKKNAR